MKLSTSSNGWRITSCVENQADVVPDAHLAGDEPASQSVTWMPGTVPSKRIDRSPIDLTMGLMDTPPVLPVSESAPAIPGKDERTWAMVAHLSAFSYYITGIGIILGPLIVWLAKRDGNPFVDEQAKEALNFQISIVIYYIAAILLCFTVILAVIGVPILIGLHVFQVICMIIAAIKANDGIAFRYPATIRLVK